jgi:hypothetical protein
MEVGLNLDLATSYFRALLHFLWVAFLVAVDAVGIGR